jgi:hypothetical protein
MSVLLVLLFAVGSGACAEKEESSGVPELGVPALTLHVCLRSEPEHDGPCTEEALQNCPAEQGREACLRNALNEIAAIDSYVANPPRQAKQGLPPVAVAGILIATFGMFALIGRRVVGRTRERNKLAFEAELPGLVRAGFRDAGDRRPPAIRTLGPVTRRLLHEEGQSVWVLESESTAMAINSAYPVRYAVAQLRVSLPAGFLTPQRGRRAGDEVVYVRGFGDSPQDEKFVHLCRKAIDPLFPNVALEADGSTVVLRSDAAIKPVGREAPTPPSLLELGEAALRLVRAIEDSSP